MFGRIASWCLYVSLYLTHPCSLLWPPFALSITLVAEASCPMQLLSAPLQGGLTLHCTVKQVDNDTMEMLRSMNMGNLPGLSLAPVSP